MTLTDLLVHAIRPKTTHTWTSVMLGVGIGAVAGLLAGVLLAPRSGELTRDMVAGKAKDAFSRVKTSVAEAPVTEAPGEDQ